MIRCLIVDDEYIVRMGLRQTINWSRYGMEIIGEADNGNKALSLIKELEIQLVFVDIIMPGMNGIELLKRIKELYPEVLIVLLTCHMDFDYAQQALRYGALDYILKTELESEELDQNLRRVSNKARDIMQSKCHLADQAVKNEDTIVEILSSRIWFMVKKDFEELLLWCRKLSDLRPPFLEKLAFAMDFLGSAYHVEDIIQEKAMPSSQMTGNDLADYYADLEGELYCRFTQSPYPTEIVLQVLRALNRVYYGSDEILNQNALSEKYGFSRSYFSRIFKEIVGISFQDSIKTARIERAKEMIRARNVPLEDIYGYVGLKDPVYFSRFFYQQTGYTLDGYQKLISEGSRNVRI